MNLQEILSRLYDLTETITVYAAQATDYIEGAHVPSIGIRAYFAGYKNYSPLIDNISFMICGDIYSDCNGVRKLTDIHDLNSAEAGTTYYFVRLRAVSSTYPIATIDIGRYEITSKSDIDENGNITMNLTRMV